MKDPFSRRALLKGCAAFSLGSALAPLQPLFSQPKKSSKSVPGTTLYLCCHGLFAFVLRQDHILLLTPRIDEHKYLAGTWRSEKDMKKGGSYSLLGSSKGEYSNRRPVISKDNLHLSGIKDIDLASSFCQIKLPFPEQFISLRHVQASFTGKSFAAANAPSASTFPLLQVLKYEMPDPQNCRFEGLDQPWKPDPHAAIQQMHIFAEPPDLVPGDHASRAFDALVQIFPGVELTLKPGRGLAPCPHKEPGSPRAIDLEQELSLSERDNSCSSLVKKGDKPHKDRGPQPGNCFSVIVDCC